MTGTELSKTPSTRQRRLGGRAPGVDTAVEVVSLYSAGRVVPVARYSAYEIAWRRWEHEVMAAKTSEQGYGREDVTTVLQIRYTPISPPFFLALAPVTVNTYLTDENNLGLLAQRRLPFHCGLISKD